MVCERRYPPSLVFICATKKKMLKFSQRDFKDISGSS